MTDAAQTESWRAVESVARQAYSKLVAWLAYQWRDVASAEDALAQALTTALERWPREGIPATPEAWIMTVAKRELLQQARHQRTRSSAEIVATLEILEDRVSQDGEGIPDDRMRLLFVCAHPAIDPAVHCALMLQSVLGIEAARIAPLYLQSPTAIAQRLVRAKSKIRKAGIAFEVPERDQLESRLESVLEAIYAAYALGWADNEVVGLERTEFSEEAVFLSRLVAEFLPDEPEALGLRALLELCESRSRARVDSHGCFVPLHQQDTKQWNVQRIVCANQLLRLAAGMGRPGRFQLEAAINAAHAQRAFGEPVPWREISMLYRGLRHFAPTTGAAVAEAVALTEAGEPARASNCLQALDEREVTNYLPYWVARARVAEGNGEVALISSCLRKAISLSREGPIRRYLESRLSRCAVSS